MSDQLHIAERPSWRCTGCGQDWPCDPARELLTTEFDNARVNLAVAMAVELGRAAGDMPKASAGDLYHRFISWTRPAPVEVLP